MSSHLEVCALEDYQSGNWERIMPGENSEYQAFVPSLIEKNWVWRDPEINMLLERANLQLGMLNSFANRLPNIDVYIKTHIRAEANKSSRIEGTRTTIEEDLLPPEEIAPEKRNDHQEVQNYIRAINYGVEQTSSPSGLPLCNRLFREIHKILLAGVRGEYKLPGEFRRSQNWIGGSNIMNAAYVPPSHERLPELLADFERFINNDRILVPVLIKCAILHYQFETIHPFLDGNGRIGRLSIPLYLLSHNVLTKPCFYISDYFERRRSEYYDALQRARVVNDMVGWVKFFLQAAAHTAENAYKKFERAVDLVERHKQTIIESGYRNASSYQRVLEVFYDVPICSIKDIESKLGLSFSTSSSVLRNLEAKGFLVETTGKTRNKMYKMDEYIKIFSEE